MRAIRSLQVTPIPKSRIRYLISPRGSLHNLGNVSGLVGENVVEKRVVAFVAYLVPGEREFQKVLKACKFIIQAPDSKSSLRIP